MTSWCPVCESQGLAVTREENPGVDDAMVRASRDLPGIEPSHFCSRCPTFFRGRDRFYLTAQHDVGVYGIAVWPHHDRHLSIEVGEDGLIATFSDGASTLIPRQDTNLIATDFFRGSNEDGIVSWAKRRGFGLRLDVSHGGIADLVVDRPGPHFILSTVKAWFQDKEIRCTEDGIDWLETIGATPVLFPPTMVEAG
jgi:hypothetical protein